MSTILIAEHDSKLLSKIERRLKQEGHQTVVVRETQRLLPAARKSEPHLVLLDLDMPNSNGLILCNELRTIPRMTNTPILFVTSQNTEVVRALDAGGDDLIRKPFDVRELSARVRALLRRTERSKHLHMLKVDVNHRRAWVNNILVELTPTEFDLLAFLCANSNDYHAAEDLLQSVWKYPPSVGDTALVRNHVHNLRHKLEINPNRPQIIVSLHGRGYRVNAHLNYIAPELVEERSLI